MEKERIYIFDTTLRDGEQAPGYSMNLDEKIRMAVQLESLGVDILEAGFSIASPGDFASVQAISRAVKNVTVAALARALPKDIDAAWQSVKEARRPRVHTFLATSDIHLQYKLKMSREQALEKAVNMVAYARNLCPEIEFSCEDASRTDLEFLCRIVERAIDAGASIINLPDTVGYATPEDTFKMVSTVMNKVPNIDKAVVAVHCHNDLGLGVANTLAGLKAGARQAECTLCGIGERSGNASLEELAMIMRTRADEYPYANHIKTEEIYRSARLLSSITGVKISPSKAIVGANAFAHESGIHQHGMMANSLTYEIMTPESVGVLTTSLVLGKHSGQHAFEKRLEDLGYALSSEEVTRLFGEFKNLADRKKTITDKDLIALVESTNTPSSITWELESFVVNSGNMMTSTACVTLKKGDKKYQEVACGTGPVYASLRAVEKIIRHPFGLEDYSLQAVTEHRDALGEVLVKISDEKGCYRGRGVSTDVIEASILSCLAAVNRMLDDSLPPAGIGVKAASALHIFENDMLSEHSDKNKGDTHA
jgi:2-isopropylmalate synthase